MSEKRYFKIEYDEEWYLFDSTTISEQLVKEQAEYGYGVFANSLSPSEVVGLLNEQQTTIQSLKSDKAIAEDYANIFEKENVKLRKQIGEQQATISALKEENEQLKQSNDRFADTVAKQVSLLIELRKENEQLRKQVAEYEMILRQHEFAEKEGFK